MENKEFKKAVYFNKIPYLFKFKKGDNELYIDIEVFKCILQNGKMVFEKKNTEFDEQTSDLNEAERVLTGSVKQDGCSNFSFYPDNGSLMAHYCSKEDAMAIGLILGECYSIAKDLVGESK